MKRISRFLSVAAFLACTACASTSHPTDAPSEIRRLDADWSHAAQSRDVERALSFWSEDAIVFPPGRSALAGKAAIRDFVETSFRTPGFSIAWQTTTVTISENGDMAYTTGTNRVTFDAPDGRRVTVDGKAVEVWRRQKDGQWKCVIDIWNDVAPAP